MKSASQIMVSLLIVLGITSCASVDDLRNSPTTLNINGTQLGLEAVVWRDFMPPTEDNGKPMISNIQLHLIGGPDILSNIHLVRQYVIYNDEIWAADIHDIGINSSYIQGTSSGGPKWGPDVLVDVVLEFTYDGTMYRIQAPDQNVERVE